MAAGLGFKTFTTGEVLTAADTNGYLMQGINVFATTAARDAAITSPQEGQFAFTKDTNGLWYYDGAAWVASGATGDIEGVTAGVGISGGGTSGTVTVTNSMATTMTTKGDLVPATGSGTFARLGVGTNGQVLTADSTAGTGLAWASSASGGMTQLATGTLSGTSVTLSSISGSYKHLMLDVYGTKSSTADDMYKFQFNGLTAGSYCNSVYGHGGATAFNYGSQADTSWQFAQSAQNMYLNAGPGQNHLSLMFYDYASTTPIPLMKSVFSYQPPSGTYATQQGAHSYKASAAAITSITMTTNGGATFSAGTYVLWGIA